MAQLIELDSQYPGGLLQYTANANDLLAASAAGENPLEGFKPSVPEGVPLEFGTEGFGAAEETGAGPVPLAQPPPPAGEPGRGGAHGTGRRG